MEFFHPQFSIRLTLSLQFPAKAPAWAHRGSDRSYPTVLSLLMQNAKIALAAWGSSSGSGLSSRRSPNQPRCCCCCLCEALGSSFGQSEQHLLSRAACLRRLSQRRSCASEWVWKLGERCNGGSNQTHTWQTAPGRFYLRAAATPRRSRHYHHLVVGQSIFKPAPDLPHRQGLPLFQQFVVTGGKRQTVELI